MGRTRADSGPRVRHLDRGSRRSLAPPSLGWYESPHTFGDGSFDVRDDRSHVLPLARRRDRGAAGEPRLRRSLRPGRRATRRDGRGRLRPRLVQLRRRGRMGGASDRRQRAPSLRLERLLQRALPRGPRGHARAPLPDRPRDPLVAHLRARHQARSPSAPGRANDRGRGACRQGRLLAPAHRPLRARRHLHVEPRRRRQRRRARRGRADRPRHLRGHGRLGDRPWRAVLLLRRLVAPERGRRGDLGVGDAVDDRGRAQSRGPARQALRPPPRLLEPLGGQADAAG